MIERMSGLASSPAIAIVGAGAALANPGGFIPLALKAISETKPSTAEYAAQWVFFSLVALLPLAAALVLLLVAPARAGRTLGGARAWIERHARTVAAAILLVLAAALLRNGISGLTS
jgi:Sap, sulfolipid-1-addressing protein